MNKDLAELQQTLLAKLTENERLQDKMELARQKFVDAAKDNDRKRADEARLEYVTLMDMLFDGSYELIQLTEKLKKTLCPSSSEDSSNRSEVTVQPKWALGRT